ncbi:hypothetical protein [Oleiagrimonas sp. C23AA]|uniref:hypothetical protein n=1 Tax=Oleiagrimonas sp. C23AA TaxID=2719047 RepID=UPI00141DD9F1|nr:hypothetical protein [Oleiagrimonas sp. C23AA]NII10165.1 hypothetical protein [Oleiagrimonas sp. C23AA]
MVKALMAAMLACVATLLAVAICYGLAMWLVPLLLSGARHGALQPLVWGLSALSSVLLLRQQRQRAREQGKGRSDGHLTRKP